VLLAKGRVTIRNLSTDDVNEKVQGQLGAGYTTFSYYPFKSERMSSHARCTRADTGLS